MTNENEPRTIDEADAYDRRTRRQLWIGLAAAATVVLVLILIVMESRYRAALDDPRPSAALDETMAVVVADLAPLPQDAREIVLTTRGEQRPRYEVVIRDGDGEHLYDMTRSASSAGVIEHGRRAGEAIRFRVELSLSEDGELEGAYRPDRGVSVERYQDVAAALVRESLIAWHTHQSYPAPDAEERSSDDIRDGWRRVMD
ncbi:hypothetical protein [Aquisalimonas asiatica]|uniref:Uncharacterized protein n=1 Tax=Aquisalimonas asiatica TaxID=406100 RepID=A0A1H8PKW5_9GAMM|nr:hypothetical protein [Aquisalimonas asiatica]SEO42555.1 hypothetical protein SAMN04488052_10117 [Aquisalimonas asiatica]